jgi:ABC-2 type transport system ATP-binding protein
MKRIGIIKSIAKLVLLLDQPTSGLDPKASNEFSMIIKRFSKKGTSILMAVLIFLGQRMWQIVLVL